MNLLRAILLVVLCGCCSLRVAGSLLTPKQATVPGVVPMTVIAPVPAPTGMHVKRSAQGVVLSWNSTTNPAVTGYQIFSGQAPGNYTMSQNVLLVTNLVFTNLPLATNYFAAKAHDTAWDESPISAEVSVYVARPVPRTNLLITLSRSERLTQLQTASGLSGTWSVLTNTCTNFVTIPNAGSGFIRAAIVQHAVAYCFVPSSLAVDHYNLYRAGTDNVFQVTGTLPSPLTNGLATVTNPASANHYIVTAVDTDGVESAPSNMATDAVAPQTLTIQAQ